MFNLDGLNSNQHKLKNRYVSMRFPVEVVKTLDTLAKKKNVTRTKLVFFMINSYLENISDNKK